MRTIIGHDLGYTELISGARNFVSDPITAILVDVMHTPADTEEEYSEVSANECVDVGYPQRQIAGKSIEFADDVVKIHHSKINFSADAPGGRATIAAKYIYLIFGTAGALLSADRILGRIDLTMDGNASVENGEFSATPHADGLFYVQKPEPV